MTIHEVTLYYTNPAINSDKFWSISVYEVGNEDPQAVFPYVVTITNGRRGTRGHRLNFGEYTYNAALTAAEQRIFKKVDSGYTLRLAGEPHSSLRSEVRSSFRVRLSPVDYHEPSDAERLANQLQRAKEVRDKTPLPTRLLDRKKRRKLKL